MAERALFPALLFGLVVGLGFIAGSGVLTYDAYQDRTATEEVDGTIVSSTVSGSIASETYLAHIRYEYSHEGRNYTRSNIFARTEQNAAEFSSREDAESFIADYPEGSSVTVHVDPDDPSNPYLAYETRLQNWAIFPLLTLLGGTLVGFVFREIRGVRSA